MADGSPKCPNPLGQQAEKLVEKVTGDESGSRGIPAAWWLLVVVNALLAAWSGITPSLANQHTFGADIRDVTVYTLWRMLAAGFIIITGAAYALQYNAKKGTLNMPTASKLMLGVLTHELMSLVLMPLAAPYLRREALLLGPPIFITAGTVAGVHYHRANPGTLKADKIKESTMKAVKHAPEPTGRGPKAVVSVMYGILSLVDGLLGVICLAAPTAFNAWVFGTAGPDAAAVLTRTLGGGFLVPSAIMLYALKDATERNRLQAFTHKVMNATFAIAAGIKASALLPAYQEGGAGPGLPALLGLYTLATGFFSSMAIAGQVPSSG